MRLFIAIPLPEPVKEKASLLQEVLDKKKFRLTKKEQMHLTMAFLGEIDEREISNIINKLEKVRFNPFNLRTKSFGFFPSTNKIRVA